MSMYGVKITERQRVMLEARGKELGIELDEMVRRVLDAWLEEKKTNAAAACPFVFDTVNRGLEKLGGPHSRRKKGDHQPIGR